MAVEIIGRREELLAFEGFLAALPAGGQAMLLEGDPGIGKTALWQEGNRLARERGFRVLTSRSAHSETQIAFATVGDLFAPAGEGTLPKLPAGPRRARASRSLPPRWPRSKTQPASATVGVLSAPVVEETLPKLPAVQRRALE